MILGMKCAAQDVKLTRDDLREALSRVRNEFAFIGITEYYTETVCLFHRMFGAPIHPHELQNLRFVGQGRRAVNYLALLGEEPGLNSTIRSLSAVTRPTEDFEKKFREAGYTSLPKDAWHDLPVDADPYDWEVYKVRGVGVVGGRSRWPATADFFLYSKFNYLCLLLCRRRAISLSSAWTFMALLCRQDCAKRMRRRLWLPSLRKDLLPQHRLCLAFCPVAFSFPSSLASPFDEYSTKKIVRLLFTS